MTRRPWPLAPLLAGILTAPAEAQETHPYLGIEAGYQTGELIPDQREDLLSVYLQAGVVAARWDAGLSVPYHYLSAEGAEDESGLGDAVLRAGYELLPEGDDGLSLYGSGAVKLPTGDESSGLGTGEADYGGYLSLRQRWSDFRASLYGGYVVTGDPAGADYDDVVTLGGRGAMRVGRGWAYAGLERRSALDGAGDDPVEAFAGGFGPLSPSRTLTGQAFVGLSNGAPDFGFRLGVIQWF